MQHTFHTIDTATAQKLIDRFFLGDTSLAEEQALYAYFAQTHIDSQLTRYAPMFRDLAAASLGATPTIAKRQHGRKMGMLTGRRIAAMAAMAAVILVVASMATAALHSYHENAMLARCYEGSYVIENGKRIDDLHRIHKQIETTLRAADAIEREVQSDGVVEQATHDVLNNIDDPAERQRLTRLLED